MIRPPVVTDNFSKGNGDDGIEVGCAGDDDRAQQGERQRRLGIEAVPGVVDGGGNKAAGNGNPAQCVNVEL